MNERTIEVKYFVLGVAFLLLAISMAYTGSLSSAWHLDDYHILNHVAQDSKVYLHLGRPLGYLTFKFNFQVSQNNPESYHFVNILLHLVNCVLLFMVGLQLASLFPGIKNRSTGQKILIAWFPALLWGLHPVNSMAVTYIAQRFTLLAAGGVLIALWACLKARLTGKKRYFFLALPAFLLGLLCKENIVLLPGVLFFINGPSSASKRFTGLRLIAIFVLVGLLGLGLAMVLWGPHLYAKFASEYQARDFNLFTRLMTEGRVIIHYLTLALLPAPERLNFDYNFSISQGLFTPLSTAASWLLLVGGVGAALAFIPHISLALLGVVWLGLALIPESSVLPLEIIFEHRLYVPLIGLSFCLLALLMRISLHQYRTLTVFLALWAGIWGYWTYERNQVYVSELSLWRDVLTKTPNNLRAHINLGVALTNEYLKEMQKAAPVNPMAEVLKLEAEQEFRLAAREPRERAISLFDLGILYLHAGEWDAAIKVNEELRRLRPRDPRVLNNLGAALAGAGRFAEALPLYREALAYVPSNTDILTNLAYAEMKCGLYPEARETLWRVLLLAPASPRARQYGELINSSSKTFPFKK